MQIYYDIHMVGGCKHNIMSITDDSPNSVGNNTNTNFEINATGIHIFFLHSIVLKA